MIIVADPILIDQSLHELGLPAELLREAVLAGEHHRASTTELDPPSAPGYYAWSRTVRHVSEMLKVRGWVRIDDRGLPLVVNPATKIAIAVMSGDEGTGVASGQPRTKH